MMNQERDTLEYRITKRHDVTRFARSDPEQLHRFLYHEAGRHRSR